MSMTYYAGDDVFSMPVRKPCRNCDGVVSHVSERGFPIISIYRSSSWYKTTSLSCSSPQAQSNSIQLLT